MITKFSKMKKATFIEETFEQFAERNGIETLVTLPSKYSGGYIEDVVDIAEDYFDMIPKTYKKQFPAKKQYYPLYETYVSEVSEKEDKKAVIQAFENLFAQINAAVEKDRQDWNNIPTLPGLSNKGRKPGSKNKEKVIPVEEILTS